MAHLTDIPYIDGNNLLEYLSALSAELPSTKGDIELLVVGGSALALKYQLRMTVDIDAELKYSHSVKDAVIKVAHRFGIPSDWINDDFTKSDSYSIRLWTYAEFYKQVGKLRVYVVDDLSQVCMKLNAGRRKDKEDLEYLVSKCKDDGLVWDDVIERYRYLYGESLDETKPLAKIMKVKMSKKQSKLGALEYLSSLFQ